MNSKGAVDITLPLTRIGEDILRVSQLAARIRIGCTAEERAFPQRVLLNLDMSLNTQQSATTRNLEDSVCYVQLREALLHYWTSQEWHLVEELAERTAEFILRWSALISQVHVDVQKFIFMDAAWAGVSITRARSEA